ncbi:hypothetical protein HZS55_09045 [Halosimplex rubrum]|uniref:Uncharacterized protein n=1 Tax=Halosimplex rubrum TaxID=869889 RepID=A0A7D5T449_9EURY|nr:hypothetical protein [Halosimplex rubrum]QLH77430.1 hypothetical protein HZS55_09045 [Halosimplex rubrum]
MDRRRFLQGFGITAGLIAGCSSDERTRTDTSGPNRTDADPQTQTNTDAQVRTTRSGSTPEALPPTAKPTEKPSPTATKSPTHSPTPTTTPGITFPLELSGEDAYETKELVLTDTALLFEFDFAGGKLQLSYTTTQGAARTVTFANIDGVSTGTCSVVVPDRPHRYQIRTGGDWSVTIRPPERNPETATSLPFSESGSSYDVLGPIEVSGRTTVSVDTDSDRRGYIRDWNWNDFDLLYRGDQIIDYDGYVFLEPRFDREWSVSLRETPE